MNATRHRSFYIRAALQALGDIKSYISKKTYGGGSILIMKRENGETNDVSTA